MCLIIAKPQNAKLPTDEQLAAAYENNSDGFGIVALNGNRFEIEKTLGDHNEISKLIANYAGLPALLHWRFCTHGDVTLENTHPFQIAFKAKHGLDAVVAHNGVIDIDHEKTESDTVSFLRHTLKPLCKHGVGLLHTPAVRNLAQLAIGSGSKLAIFTSDGRMSFVNEDSGHWDKETGCWLSNKYSLYTAAGGYGRWQDWEDWEDDFPTKAGGATKQHSASSQTTTSNVTALPAPYASERDATLTNVLSSLESDTLAREIADARETAHKRRIEDEGISDEEAEDAEDPNESGDYSATTLDVLRGMSWSDIQSLCYEDPDTAAELLYEASTQGFRRVA